MERQPHCKQYTPRVERSSIEDPSDSVIYSLHMCSPSMTFGFDSGDELHCILSCAYCTMERRYSTALACLLCGGGHHGL